ncbi:MAG: MFS transporter [Anaerolineaceae bacterium]|nr:MFS transporter [Anaerolineaceae bacterium]
MKIKIRKIQFGYYSINFLYWFSIALPLALTTLLKMSRGLDLFQISLCMGIYSLAILILVVPAGGLADTIGRKRVSIAAYGVMALGSFSLLFTFTFPGFLLVMFLAGVARSFSPGPLDAWFIDELKLVDPDINLQEYLAKANTIVWLALGTGLLVGSYIPNIFGHLPADGTHVLEPFSIPILISAMIQVILIGLTILLVNDHNQPDRNMDWRDSFAAVPELVKNGFQESRKNPIIPYLMGASAAAYLAMATLETLWQPFFSELPGTMNDNSLFYGVVMGGSFLAGMLGNLAATPINRWVKNRFGLICAIFLGFEGVMLITLSFQTSVIAAVIFFWLVYISMSVVHSPHMAMINKEIPSGKRTTILSMETLIGQVGGILGSVVLGYIADKFSIHITWVLGGLILMGSIWFYWMADREDRKRKMKEFSCELEQRYV